MAAVGQRYRPYVVIDDGSHQADHILTSFQQLYPSLREGGHYIVEDLGMHAGSEAVRNRGSAPMSPQKFFLTLANRVTCPAEDVEFDRHTVWSTESVEFFQDVVVINKKRLRAPDRIDSRRLVVQKTDSHRIWGWFSKYLLNNGGSIEEAIDCAQRAVALNPLQWPHHFNLSRALEQAGRLDEALAAAEDAVRCAPNTPLVGDNLARLALAMERQRHQS
jgi:tetratricopeptide (TPR) repeat protein